MLKPNQNKPNKSNYLQETIRQVSWHLMKTSFFMSANLVVKFCGKSQILWTKNTYLFEQNFLNTNTESTKNSNITSPSNKNKIFIERANQWQYCKYVKLKLLFYTHFLKLNSFYLGSVYFNILGWKNSKYNTFELKGRKLTVSN